MRLLIRYHDGSFAAAILMATIGSRLRVAVAGSEDIVEFGFAEGQWLAENGQAVAIEFDPAVDEFYSWAQRAAAVRQEPSEASIQALNQPRLSQVASIAPVN